MDLPEALLAVTEGSTIYLDADAAGNGWFIDDTPLESNEYHRMADHLEADHNSSAYGRVDLLTVMLHEIGHLLGYQHTSDGLMSETLAPGERDLDIITIEQAAPSRAPQQTKDQLQAIIDEALRRWAAKTDIAALSSPQYEIADLSHSINRRMAGWLFWQSGFGKSPLGRYLR